MQDFFHPLYVPNRLRFHFFEGCFLAWRSKVWNFFCCGIISALNRYADLHKGALVGPHPAKMTLSCIANKGDTPPEFVNSQLQLATSCNSHPWAAETEWMNTIEKMDVALVRVSAQTLLLSIERSKSCGYSQHLSPVQSYHHGPTFESNRIPCALSPIGKTFVGSIAMA